MKKIKEVLIGSAVVALAFSLTYSVDVGTKAIASSFRQAPAVTTPTFNLTPYTYGAVGDGVTDDTAAWQSCLNAATAIGNQQIQVAPSSRFKITSTLYVFSA